MHEGRPRCTLRGFWVFPIEILDLDQVGRAEVQDDRWLMTLAHTRRGPISVA